MDGYILSDWDYDLIFQKVLEKGLEYRPYIYKGKEGIRLNASDVCYHPSSGSKGGVGVHKDPNTGLAVVGCFTGCDPFLTAEHLKAKIFA